MRAASRALSICWLALLAAGLLWPAAAATRVPWTSNRVIGSTNPPAPYTVERLFPKLKFDRPVDLAALPGTDRIMVLEQGGKLLSFRGRPETERTELAFEFQKHHQPFDSAYAFAFHPKFLENRFLFVCYAEPGGRTNGSHVSRFTVRPTDPPTIDPESERVILRWLSGGHNGCTLAFGNDGLLYISTGDAANPDPPDWPHKTGQDISDLLASILRIDVDRTEGTNNYAIPPGNPFVETSGARPEVYAFGFRNPWRMSFDPATGDLWAGDVGWEEWEMIYRVKPGGNYGWSLTEGPNTHVRTDVEQGPGPILPAMVALPHSEAASITGGRVYHGTRLPRLTGAYLYGDWETGKFWALRNDGDRLVSNLELCHTTLRPVSFAADHQNELLILDYNGGIYQFVPNTAPPANLAFPRRLSQTGLYLGLLADLSPAPGVIPYRPNAAMWSDHAVADRVLGVPDSDAIITADGRETITGKMWYFPSNTVLARTLTLEMENGQPSSRRRIETQLMHFDGQAWQPYTYRWNPDQTDASLVPPEGTNDVFTLIDPRAPGGRREIPWRFSSRAECLRCHNVWASDTLSFNWPQLHGDGDGSEMSRLAKLGVIQPRNPPKPAVALVDPHDSSLPLEARARSWLHVNCASCHRFGAGGGVPSQLNSDQALAVARTLDAVPVRGGFGIPGARVIASGDPFRSTLFYRISTEGAGHMPQIGSRLIDEEGVRLLRDWIRSLPQEETSDPEILAARQIASEIPGLLDQCAGPARETAVGRLMSNTSGALALLDFLSHPPASSETGHKVPESDRESIREAVLLAAGSHSESVVRDLFQHLLPPEQRRRTLGWDFDPQTVLNLQGDRGRGRDLFHGASQCASCHVADGAGRAYGPDLTAISLRYKRAELLEHIIDPAKFVAPEYALVSVTLKDDTELTGFLMERTDAELILRDGSLVDHRVRLSDVREEHASGGSSMPEGLLAPLTAQEAADLLEYLAARESTRTP